MNFDRALRLKTFKTVRMDSSYHGYEKLKPKIKVPEKSFLTNNINFYGIQKKSLKKKKDISMQSITF